MGPAGIDLEALGKQGKRERAHSKNEKYEKADGLIQPMNFNPNDQ
jgi:hypothetical protein